MAQPERGHIQNSPFLIQRTFLRSGQIGTVVEIHPAWMRAGINSVTLERTKDPRSHRKPSCNYSDVYCRFVFKNDGTAIDARIGFPDGPDRGFEEGEKPYFSLEHFRSCIDGKAVSLRMEVAGHDSEGGRLADYDAPVYHVKSVHFAKGQTRIIEDWYRTDHSGEGTNSMTKKGDENLYISLFTYVMASGGSWNGNIGEAVVDVRFMEKKFRHLRTIAESEFGDVFESKKLNSLPKDRVIWSGYYQPAAHENRVIFEKRNFKPTMKDNISLAFDWLPFKESTVGRDSSKR